MWVKELSKTKIFFVLTVLALLIVFPDFSSAQTAVVRGIVIDRQGNPLEDAKITFYDQTRGTKYTTRSNKKGEFIKMINVGSPPSVYKLTVELEDYFPFESQYQGKWGVEEELKITLEKIPPKIEEDRDYAEGINFFQQDKYKDAIESFKKSMERFPDNMDILYNMGVSYLRDGNLDEAINYLNKTTELNPEVIEFYLALGECYFKKGEREKALETFSRAVEIQPDNPKTHYNLGIVHYRDDRTEQAIQSFETSIELDPNFSSSYYQLGLAYTKTEDFKKAIKCFEEFLRLEPNSSDANLVKEMIEKLKK